MSKLEIFSAALALAWIGVGETVAQPIAVYPFDEAGGSVVTDSTGNGNDGLIYGASRALGYQGYALSFGDSPLDRVVLDPSFLNALGNHAYVEAWIKPSAYAVNSSCLGTIFRKRAHYNDWAMSLVSSANGHFAGNLFCDLWGTSATGWASVGVVGGSIPLNQWSKVACWYDGSSMWALVNGVEVGSNQKVLTPDWGPGPFATFNQVEIGNDSYDYGVNCPDYVFRGLIDDVYIGTGPPALEPPAGPLCQAEDFSNDLGDLSFDLIGDADEGGALVVNGRAELTSNGTVFYHGLDNGGFLRKAVTGDFRAQIRLEGFPIDGGGGYRRSGLVVRSGIGAADPRVFVEFLPSHPAYNKTALMFDYRDNSGTARELASTKLGLTAPLYLSIDRRGDRFTVGYSLDGVNWVKPAGAAGGSVEIAMPPTVQVGVMQASYSETATLTSAVDDLEICRPDTEPLPPIPPQGPCASGSPVDIVYLMDLSGSSTTAFPGGPTRFDAAREAIHRLNTLVEFGLPGSQAALLTYQGGPAPAYATGAGAAVRAALTSDFSQVETAAATLSVSQIHPTTSSSLSQALQLARQLLEQDGRPLARQVVLLVGDGFVNVDAQGNGPTFYKTTELQTLSIFSGGNFRTVGETAWLGGWNGPIATWDGQVLADVMEAALALKQSLPRAEIDVIALNSDALTRADLLQFVTAFTAGRYFEAGDLPEVISRVDDLFSIFNCNIALVPGEPGR